MWVRMEREYLLSTYLDICVSLHLDIYLRRCHCIFQVCLLWCAAIHLRLQGYRMSHFNIKCTILEYLLSITFSELSNWQIICFKGHKKNFLIPPLSLWCYLKHRFLRQFPVDTRCQRSPPHNLRPVFSDRRRLDCVKGSAARCLESGQDNAGGWAEDTLGHACHLVLCLHWPLHAPTTTRGRKYVALLFCTDFALSFPRDVCIVDIFASMII